VVLNCWGRMDDMQGIANRLPAMTAEASARLDAALAYPQGQEADRAQLLAKRDGAAGPGAGGMTDDGLILCARRSDGGRVGRPRRTFGQ
jgi:hypothetical protein